MTTAYAQRQRTINADVSDLFFNRDFSNIERHDGTGGFAGYDKAALHAEAEAFLVALVRLGVEDIPSVDHLIADFYERL